MKEKYKKSSPEDLKGLYHKSSKELLAILTIAQHNYSDELINAIKEELLKRGTSQNDIEFASESYFKAIEKEKRESEASKRNFLKYAMMFIGLSIGTGIVKTCNETNNTPSDKWLSLQAVVNREGAFQIKDTIKRKKWCDCVMSTFKSQYPNGLGGVPQDTINVKAATISFDCIRSLNNSQNISLPK